MPQQSEVFVEFTEIDEACASIVIRGDLDLSAEPDLFLVLPRILAADYRTVIVDLGGLGFVGAALPNFLIRVHHALGRGAAIEVRRPGVMARRILAFADLPQGVLYIAAEPESPAVAAGAG